MFKTTMTMYYRIYNTWRSTVYENDSTKVSVLYMKYYDIISR